jgi:hypothetical protein
MAHHYLLSTFFQTYMSKAMLQPERSSAWSKFMVRPSSVQVPEKTKRRSGSRFEWQEQDMASKFMVRPSVQVPEKTREEWILA